MATHNIKVTFQGGVPRVDPEECRMCEGDEVKWVGTGPQKFNVEFEKDSPIGAKTLPHGQATRSNRVAKGTVRKPYRYSVVPEANPSGAVDPVIVIEDPSHNP